MFHVKYWKKNRRWSDKSTAGGGVRGWQSIKREPDIVSWLLTNTWIRTRFSTSAPFLNPFIPLLSTDFSIPPDHKNGAKRQNEKKSLRSEEALKAIPTYCLHEGEAAQSRSRPGMREDSA